ncbi:uncharacterized protein LOC62_03G003955 [Vanrija pseudolonga]|uniref:Uncharacterized protein n=1 Tax=Vanrija pseudolonga TaxID=143232 RepID=A0AAF0Y5N1_9TREE|nr:hypothetical protein LOC62_03G003955 [Vanrija pseudolonga]
MSYGASAARRDPHATATTSSSFSATMPAVTPASLFGLTLRTHDISQPHDLLSPASAVSSAPKSALAQSPFDAPEVGAPADPEVDAGPLPVRPPPSYDPSWSAAPTPTESTGHTAAYESMKPAILLEREEEGPSRGAADGGRDEKR